MTYSLDALPNEAMEKLVEERREGKLHGLRSYTSDDRHLIRWVQDEIYSLQQADKWDGVDPFDVKVAVIDYYERKSINIPPDGDGLFTTTRPAAFHYGMTRDDGQRQSLVVLSRDAAAHFDHLYDEVIRHELAHAYVWITRGRGHRDGEGRFERACERFDGGTSDRKTSKKLGKEPYYKRHR